MAKLGDIATIQSGGTPARSIAEYWEDGTIPWVKISDIKSKHLNQTEEMITEAGLENSSAKIFPKGTILYTIFATLGETSILDINAATNQAIAGISITDSRVLPDYLYYYLLSQKIHVQKIGRGVAQNNINMKLLRDFDVPLPSKEAQLNIIEQLNRVTELLFLRKQQLTKLDELIKARFVEMFGDCRLNPKGWVTKNLDQVADVGSSKRVFVEELQSEGIPFYRGTEVGALAEGKSIRPELFITEEHYKQLCEATGKPQKGDLLMPSICPDGRIWVVDTDAPFYFKDGRVLWVHLTSRNYNPVFLLYTLKDRIMTDYESIASGTTFAELKIFALKKCRIFDVPLSLQNQFADFVAEVDKSKLLAGSAVAHKPFDIEFFSKSTVQRPIKEV